MIRKEIYMSEEMNEEVVLNGTIVSTNTSIIKLYSEEEEKQKDLQRRIIFYGQDLGTFQEIINLQTENTKLKQEKKELEKKMYLIIMELYSENIINANIEEMRNILEKLGE